MTRGHGCLVVSAKAETHDQWPVFVGPGSPPAVRASAGTTIAIIATRTNLRLYETSAGPPSLLPACSLQGTVQLQRVTT
jgi:hypothetical protein